MSNDDVLEESGKYRVRVVQDQSPEEPYDDGGSPILCFEWDGRYDRWTVNQVGSTGFKVPHTIIMALERFGDEGRPRRRSEWAPTFERYLRIFHGTTSVVWHSGRDANYVTFDTAEWREKMGLTDEYVAAYLADHELANMDEYIAYLDGECYGWVIEELETWGRLNDAGELATSNYGRREQWATVDSCWGYYGADYAVEAAHEAFAYYIAPTVQVTREEG